MLNRDKIIEEMKNTRGQYRYYTMVEDTGPECGIMRFYTIRVDKNDNIEELSWGEWRKWSNKLEELKDQYEFIEKSVDDMIRQELGG